MHPDAKDPLRATKESNGFDLFAVSKNATDKYVEYDTGVSFSIPKGYVGLLFPRSSISNKDLTMANSVGVIDIDFRGTVRFRFKLTSKDQNPIFSDTYNVGDRVGQILFLPNPEIVLNKTNYLTTSERSSGGFGSTGL